MIAFEELAPQVICTVLRGYANEDGDKRAAADTKSELAIEDFKSYELKLGRWHRDVLTTVAYKLFWTVAQNNYSAKSPIDYFQACC